MGRNWQPKYKVVCERCGWTGTRTNRMMLKPCPKCGYYYPKKAGVSND